MKRWENLVSDIFLPGSVRLRIEQPWPWNTTSESLSDELNYANTCCARGSPLSRLSLGNQTGFPWSVLAHVATSSFC